MPPTIRSYDAFEVVSAFQKSLRRGLVDDSLYWGAELYRSGFGAWAWKRLRVCVSEDCGPAAPGLPADVAALHQTAKDLLKNARLEEGLMFFLHATILVARAPKSRIVDDALFTVADTDQPPDREVPDHALDMHTRRGRRMGRGVEHFYEEAKLENEADLDNPYRDRARDR